MGRTPLFFNSVILAAGLAVVGCSGVGSGAAGPAASPVVDKEQAPAPPESRRLEADKAPYAFLWIFDVKKERVADYEALSARHSALIFEHNGSFYRWDLMRSGQTPGRYWTHQVVDSKDVMGFHTSPAGRIGPMHWPLYATMVADPNKPLSMAGAGLELFAQRTPYGEKSENSPELSSLGGEGETWQKEELARAHRRYNGEKGRAVANFAAIELFKVAAGSEGAFEKAFDEYVAESLQNDPDVYRLDVIKDDGARGYPSAGSDKTWYHLHSVFASSSARDQHLQAMSSHREVLQTLGSPEVVDTGTQLLPQREPYK